jgi:LCP family protein required for cell wall assembly
LFVSLALVLGGALCLVTAAVAHDADTYPQPLPVHESVVGGRTAGRAVKLVPAAALLAPLPAAPAGPIPAIPAPAPTEPPVTGVVHILLLGKDERPREMLAGAAGRTDSMMVLRLDFDHGRARLLSFPRDMIVALPGLGAYGITSGKINTAYHYGELYNLPGGGPRLAIDTLRLNFGIPIDHYALIDFQGFVEVVDALGGIDIDVPRAIHDEQFPTDDYGVMTLIIGAGRQHMDGATALRYARTRHQDSDIERLKRQQLILLAMRQKALSLGSLQHLPEIYRALSTSFETDLDLASLMSYGLAAQQIDESQIETGVMENSQIDQWVLDPEAGVWIPLRSTTAPQMEAFLAVP